MRHHAERFYQAIINTAYVKEQNTFCETVTQVARSDVPDEANFINSHTIYKVKVNDDHSSALKAQIAPHGNEESLKNDLRSDCCICPPTGIRLVLMMEAVIRWPIRKADIKSAFLQTGAAQRDVFVIPPRECTDRRFLWRLDTAAYGLVNSNPKWQRISDEICPKLGMTQCTFMPKLFYAHNSYGNLLIVAAKIVDDIIIAGIPDYATQFLQAFNDRFTLGSVASGPGRLRFYGLNVTQNEDYSYTIDADDKLTALETFPLTR